jgi:malate/lactate dehydrogenase
MPLPRADLTLGRVLSVTTYGHGLHRDAGGVEVPLLLRRDGVINLLEDRCESSRREEFDTALEGSEHIR